MAVIGGAGQGVETEDESMGEGMREKEDELVGKRINGEGAEEEVRGGRSCAQEE